MFMLFIIKAYAVNGSGAAGKKAYKKALKSGQTEAQAKKTQEKAENRYKENKYWAKRREKEQRGTTETTGRA